MTDATDLAQEKLFYERFWALHADPVLVSIFEEFGAAPFRRSSVLEGFSAFLQASGFSGKRCIEIGSWKGLTAIVLARHFDEVVSIDIMPDSERELIAGYAGILNVRFITVSDNIEKALVTGAEVFDAAFVDGNHANDTESDFALVKQCGRVLFHEYWPAQPSVFSLVNRLRSTWQVETAGKFALCTRASD